MVRIRKVRCGGSRLAKGLFLYALWLTPILYIYSLLLFPVPVSEEKKPAQFREEQLKSVERALDRFFVEEAQKKLPESMHRHYVRIRVNNDPKHYSHKDVVGHFESGPGYICAKSGALAFQPDILRHETMHGWWLSLSESDQAVWSAIRGAHATAYGATSPVEDICEWGRELQKMARGEKSALDRISREEFQNPASPHCRKLNFLYKHGGITAEEYSTPLRR